jgi:hypothetical protein
VGRNEADLRAEFGQFANHSIGSPRRQRTSLVIADSLGSEGTHQVFREAPLRWLGTPYLLDTVTRYFAFTLCTATVYFPSSTTVQGGP